MTHFFKKPYFTAALIFAVLFLGTLAIRQGFAWTNPTQAPPLGSPSGSFGQWTMSGNNIYNSNNGNVGIGTSSPAYKLDVSGDAKISGSAHIDKGVFTKDQNGTIDSWWGIYAWDKELQVNKRSSANGWIQNILTANWDTGNIALAPSGGNIGIGMTATPGARLSVLQSSNSQPAALFTNDGGSGEGVQIKAGAGGTTFSVFNAMKYDGTSLLSVRGDGNVGIGIASPAYKLDVQGKVNASSASGNGGYISTGNYGGTGDAAYFPSGLWSNGANAWIYGSISTNGPITDTASRMSLNPAGYTYFNGGNVGIGTTSPLSKLSVGGIGRAGAGIYGEASDAGVYGKGVAGVVGDGSDTGVEGFGGVYYGVYGDGPVYDFYAAGTGLNYGPFTGGHDVLLTDAVPRDIKRGMIVSVTGDVKVRRDKNGQASISSTLPSVELSKKENDNKVLGVFQAESPVHKDFWYTLGEHERYGTVNALGEGRVWVSNINGEVGAGDYITTSNVPGYGQKQEDDLLHTYTLGKATEDVDWDSVVETVDFNGKKIKVYLIGVVYVSG